MNFVWVCFVFDSCLYCLLLCCFAFCYFTLQLEFDFRFCLWFSDFTVYFVVGILFVTDFVVVFDLIAVYGFWVALLDCSGLLLFLLVGTYLFTCVLICLSFSCCFDCLFCCCAFVIFNFRIYFVVNSTSLSLFDLYVYY